jgi:hypothetical protein
MMGVDDIGKKYQMTGRVLMGKIRLFSPEPSIECLQKQVV